MGTHSPCPLHPPLPRQGQTLTMPPQPASGLDTMPLFRFIASPRSPAGFPGLFGIYITLASRGDFFFYLKIVCGRAWGGWMALAFPVNILVYSKTSFFPGALPSPLSSVAAAVLHLSTWVPTQVSATKRKKNGLLHGGQHLLTLKTMVVN